MPADDTEWVTLDTSSLSPKQKRVWQAYQDATKAAKDKREELESVLQDGLPKDKTLRVNLRFGKLQVALADAAARPTPRDTKAVSLADYLEQVE